MFVLTLIAGIVCAANPSATHSSSVGQVQSDLIQKERDAANALARDDKQRQVELLNEAAKLSAIAYGQNDWRTRDRQDRLAVAEKLFQASDEERKRFAELYAELAAGNAFAKGNKLDQELASRRRLRSLASELYGENSRWSASATHLLACAYLRQASFDKADELEAASLDQLKVSFGSDHPRYATALFDQSSFANCRGDRREELRLASRGWDVVSDLPGVTPDLLADARIRYSLALTNAGRGADAVKLLFEHLSSIPESDIARRQDCLWRMAKVAIDCGDAITALRLCSAAERLGPLKEASAMASANLFRCIRVKAFILDSKFQMAIEESDDVLKSGAASFYGFEVRTDRLDALLSQKQVDQAIREAVDNTRMLRLYRGSFDQLLSFRVAIARRQVEAGDPGQALENLQIVEQYMQQTVASACRLKVESLLVSGMLAEKRGEIRTAYDKYSAALAMHLKLSSEHFVLIPLIQHCERLEKDEQHLKELNAMRQRLEANRASQADSIRKILVGSVLSDTE